MALGFVLAGSAGVTLFGAVYGSIASGTATDMGHYVDLFKLASVSLAGHLLALSALFGTPLAAVLFSLRKVLSRDQAENASPNIAFYALTIFCTLIPVVALFSASVANAGPYETPFRLHMRYYNFAFPLLLIAVAAQSWDRKKRMQLFPSIMAATPIAIAMIYAGLTKMQPYTPNLIDSPEMRGITSNHLVFHILIIVGFLSLTFWIYDNRLGEKYFCLLLLRRL
ncbi:hypothetical protein AU467_24460 [Mesorhizobium loti]|uniref:Uncharacterized protein n=1 Tax=Rhizobium loti TaxID=381 RepID=A0A101KS82_RHILI|nr:hypothetical protein AU467_24460 [Mesorhizobium loti]